MEKEKIARINELAHLQKERALTDEEKAEQHALRMEYVAEIRASFGGMLENTVIERPDGSREQLKKKK
ncbi:MAG: DUF896 domain-containing protein [Ruminococcaceae bacterium]|nr:DUF896 domain-containing protein [Oscillospiraceae bacterium]